MNSKFFQYKFALILFLFFADFRLLEAQEILRDVKPPVDFPKNLTAWYIFVAVVLASIAAAAVYYLYRKRMADQGQKAEAAGSVDKRSPWEKAMDALNALQRKNLIAQGKLSVFYTELSDIIRRYLEDRFRLRAPEMTTEEFLDSVKNSDTLSFEQKSILKDFLTASDMVKFAKYTPPKEEAGSSFNLAKRLVEETTLRMTAGGSAE